MEIKVSKTATTIVWSEHLLPALQCTLTTATTILITQQKTKMVEWTEEKLNHWCSNRISVKLNRSFLHVSIQQQWENCFGGKAEITLKALTIWIR